MIAFLMYVILFFVLLYSMRKDDTDSSFFKKSGMSLHTDYKTGLQYLSSGFLGSLTPRLDENGEHMRVKIK